jgi:PKD repeat protein
MGKVRVVISIALISLLLTLIGCSGSDGSASVRAQAPVVGGKTALPDLPAPSTLREATMVLSGVYRRGDLIGSLIPHQLVQKNAYNLVFTPAWLGNGTDNAAYAGYVFDSTGYTSDDTVHLDWASQGTNSSDLWIGLGNFAKDRWDWFPGPATGALPYSGSIYSSSGKVYVVVVCLGSDTWELKSIRICADFPPAVRSVSPHTCMVSVPVKFSAILDGPADSYSWSFGSGINPSTSNQAAPEVQPTAEGEYAANLTVTSGCGSDSYGFTISIEPWQLMPPVAVLAADVTSGESPLTVNFDASDCYDPDDGTLPPAGIVLYEWDYNDDGTYDYSSADPTASYTYTTSGTYTCRLRVTDNDSETGTDTASISVNTVVHYYSVSGTVTMAEAGGLADVWMQLTPGYQDRTQASGAFTLEYILEGTYTLTPTLAGWTFSPATLPITLSGADITGQDFTAYSTPIADLTGSPLIGNAPLTANFDASASNDPDNGGAAGAGIAKYEWDWNNDGVYDFDSGTDATVTHNYTNQGTYICCVRVTDNESETAIDTVSLTVNSGSGYTASGYVKTELDTGLAGVTLSFSGGLASVTTDSNGFWYRGGITNGTYTVTPSMTPYTFTPLNRSFTISGDNVAVDDFIASYGLDPDTLYAIPQQTTAAVGEPVRILVATGQPANALVFLSSVGFTVETAGAYVANSFNIGEPGGARLDTDGYWALMVPPIDDDNYMDTGDSHIPGQATDIGGGLHRYNFAVISMSLSDPPASIGGGAVLFNFELSFSTPGTYHLGFQANDGAVDETCYDGMDGTHHWAKLDSSYTITVN